MQKNFLYKTFSAKRAVAKTFLIFIVATFFLTSCNTVVSVNAQNDKSGKVRLETSLTESVQSIIYSFFGTGQDTSAENAIFDKKELMSSLESAGFRVNRIVFPDPATIVLDASTDDLTTCIPDSNDFIVQTKQGKRSTLAINLSPENIQKAVAIMPEDTSMYLSMLIAPIFTGEAMTRDEYIELIGIAYGEELANELAESVINFTLTVPGNITDASFSNAEIGTISAKGSTATLRIPLANLLTDTNGTVCTITW